MTEEAGGWHPLATEELQTMQINTYRDSTNKVARLTDVTCSTPRSYELPERTTNTIEIKPAHCQAGR
ncbi:MAG: hypothetical protein IT475_06270 [Aquimonas sp.]|nr:hypothetical protein [Aquimonas sp.]